MKLGPFLPERLPAPLVPAHVDLRDVPIPRAAFAALFARTRGIPMQEARAFVDRVVDSMEADRAQRRGQGGSHDPA